MGFLLSLKYITELAPGRYEYRRRVPKAARARVGKTEFKRVFQASSPTAVARAHARITSEFDETVDAAMRPRGRIFPPTPRELAEEQQRRADELLAGVYGPEIESEKRDLLADLLADQGADSGLYRAVIMPNAPLPQHTLEDARKLYINEKLNGGVGDEHKDAADAVARVFARVQEALGERASTCPLAELKREDARKVRDHLQNREKKGGGKLSPSSVRRELNTLSAVVNHGIRELDLKGKVSNPFEGLEIKGEKDGGAETEEEKRLPLPLSVMPAMRSSLKGETALIWRLLEMSGCRLSEVVGLRVKDLNLSGPIPFMRVVWHEERRVKTRASIRVVPLIGDAVEAAREALKLPREGNLVFERYRGRRGPDAASSAMMKHLRKFTEDPRHVINSLRHNMKDDLKLGGAEKVVQDLVLGHTSDSVGERYGGEDARLEVARRALKAAFDVRDEAASKRPHASTIDAA
ncbi:site-specific recombinase XerD [Rhodobacter aestuarii]|uniref:Site-specific recombinase XerD n=1 Tax=Rhodobacter aestuarii TaxID=453582 RepID=A0A1N7PNA3_9RHOB|nr:tyrosine-type recombinase/integrase [Rhodobacter aestuarii]PTV94270.1 site-specific recombinase XerD [Rhodobacter aestuarii]SIT12124.1 Site-specific recombinase XerD [Rhodobacter aestuarii]